MRLWRGGKRWIVKTRWYVWLIKHVKMDGYEGKWRDYIESDWIE